MTQRKGIILAGGSGTRWHPPAPGPAAADQPHDPRPIVSVAHATDIQIQ